MDFERATIKGLFYDYPIESAVKAIEDALELKEDVFLDILPDLVRWRERAFTETELALMQNRAERKWLRRGEGDANSAHNILRPMLLIQHLAMQILDKSRENTEFPVVRFNNLLRWKDITAFVGEDLFTTAFKASVDASRYNIDEMSPETLLIWPDVLPHNNVVLNELLGKGLSDVHAHFNATVDVFHLNWISLMNNLHRKSGVNDIKQHQDVEFHSVGTEKLYTNVSICIAAAYLRVLFFKKYVLKQPIERKEFNKVQDILRDEFYARTVGMDLQAEIAVLRMDSLKTPSGRAIDYAIVRSNRNMEKMDDIFMVYQGERNIMYQYLLKFYGNDAEAWMLAPYYYLYILLKTYIRREFVQINPLKGFQNFETYQDRKSIFIEDGDAIAENLGKYVAQTTLRPGKKDCLEARITPGNLAARKEKFGKSVFSGMEVAKVTDESLSFVVHFIKANYTKRSKEASRKRNNKENVARYAKYRSELKENLDKVLQAIKEDKYRRKWNLGYEVPRIVGIDAASTEMFCRPEVFGHVFRYAAKMGLLQRTYHVGEDFFDIVDGLRAIDEAIMFLQLDANCRVGHALTIGVDAKKYYEKRERRVLMPRQYLLDNCVWICMRASEANIDIPNSLETYLTKLARKLYQMIGYSKPFDMNMYWNSMLLRGDEPNNSLEEEHMDFAMTDWSSTAKVHCYKAHYREIDDARTDIDARELYREYNFSHKVKENGDERYEGCYPVEIVDVVEKLQKWMLGKLSHLQIAVECNPTSNLKIGHFDRYDEHPLLTTFDPIDRQNELSYPMVNASVNTDDRGVFATSVYQELSLLALALHKQRQKDGENAGLDKYNPIAIEHYIDRIRENGFKQRFK